MRAVLKIFWFCFQFLKDKRLLLIKIKFLQNMRAESSPVLLQIGCKLEKLHWRYNFWHEVIVKFFRLCFFSLVMSSHWSMFHANTITGSVMTISFYKGFTRNLEIGKNSVGVLPNIERRGRVKNTKFGTSVSNKLLQDSAKYQGYSVYRFWVIKWKPTGG